MGIKTLNDYTCIDNNNDFISDGDPLQQFLSGAEEKNASERKKNVRKAIDRYMERKRLQRDIGDDLF
jgi:hypothetical protein